MSAAKHEILADGIEIYYGDCREILPTLGMVDAVVTDPPYGINENDKKIASRGKLVAPKDYGSVSWDKKPIDAETVSMLRAASKHQIIFGGNYFEGLGPTACWLVWDKMNGDNDFADYELAWTNLKKAVRKIEWLWNGMIRKGSEVREHPTQKPIGVMVWSIEHLPKDVLTVCDPFMGSGTTGIACVKLGKKFIGIEADERYFDIARKRISAAVSAPDMFAGAA